MKKIFFAIIACSGLLLTGLCAQAQDAQSKQPAVDTRGAESMKKQATDKTNIPDSKHAVPGKIQQENNTDGHKQAANKEEQMGKGIKIEPTPAPVALDRTTPSTIDPSKKAPARVVPANEPQVQKID